MLVLLVLLVLLGTTCLLPAGVEARVVVAKNVSNKCTRNSEALLKLLLLLAVAATACYGCYSLLRLLLATIS